MALTKCGLSFPLCYELGLIPNWTPKLLHAGTQYEVQFNCFYSSEVHELDFIVLLPHCAFTLQNNLKANHKYANNLINGGACIQCIKCLFMLCPFPDQSNSGRGPTLRTMKWFQGMGLVLKWASEYNQPRRSKDVIGLKWSQSWAWALKKSPIRPSFFLYFREIRGKRSHWPGGQSDLRLYPLL